MALDWNGPEVIAKLEKAEHRILDEGGGDLLTEAQKHCPHNEGTLEGSGDHYVDDSEGEAVIGYTVPYAPIVHEAPPSWSFQGKGRRKWLETAGRAYVNKLEKLSERILREELD